VEPRAVTKTVETQRARSKTKAVSDVPWARFGNLGLGIWLQSSVFLWPHSDGARLSAWLPGLLVSVIALLSLGAPPMRWLNAFLAMWLILWTMAGASSEPLTYLNGIVSGLLVLILSAIPSKTSEAEVRD
jgi:hypothetical protein